MEERDSASIGSQEVTGFIPYTTKSQTGVIVSEDGPAWLLVLQPLGFCVMDHYAAQMSSQKLFKHEHTTIWRV
eukprot:7678052-Ditylum_brightwellii.AAC.1